MLRAFMSFLEPLLKFDQNILMVCVMPGEVCVREHSLCVKAPRIASQAVVLLQSTTSLCGLYRIWEN